MVLLADRFPGHTQHSLLDLQGAQLYWKFDMNRQRKVACTQQQSKQPRQRTVEHLNQQIVKSKVKIRLSWRESLPQILLVSC